MHPTISRQTGRLAYTRFTEEQDLWILHPGGQPEVFGSSTYFDVSADFSPDNTKIAFSSGRSGQPNIWVINRDGTNPRQLTKSTGRLQGTPRWSPDGLRIAFDSVGPDGHTDVYVIDADGGQQKRVTVFAENDSIPSWSRDGKSIYFQSTHTGRPEVWKVPIEGGPPVQITQAGGAGPLESFDRQKVFYNRDGALFEVPVAGGEEKQILPSVKGWDYYPVKDGIYYIDQPDRQRAYMFGIRFFDFATRATSVLSKFESRPGAPGFSVSNDGQTILFSGESLAHGSDLMLFENFR